LERREEVRDLEMRHHSRVMEAERRYGHHLPCFPGSPLANDVQSAVIPGAGHWFAEQAPEETLAALTEFLAPYRDGS
jgi:pimeloyl-ACP methyl ester carboxylesterase